MKNVIRGNPARWNWTEGELHLVNDDGSLTRIGDIPLWACHMQALKLERARAGLPPLTFEEYNAELATFRARLGD